MSKKKKISDQKLDPPRQPWETVEYEDDPFELGDVDENNLKIVPDFLPAPEDLVFKGSPQEKITITLDSETVAFFRQKATELGSSYQRMIRNLLNEYVARMK